MPTGNTQLFQEKKDIAWIRQSLFIAKPAKGIFGESISGNSKASAFPIGSQYSEEVLSFADTSLEPEFPEEL